jgi:hypothetical protein
VITKDCIESFALKFFEDAGAMPGGTASKRSNFWSEIVLPANGGRDEISGEKYGVGLDAVDAVNNLVKKERLGVVIHVDVAELDNAHAVKGGGQIAQIEVALCDLDPMALDLAGVEGQSGSTAEARDKEAAPADGPVGRGES